jgi:NAD(P)H-dependent FMN reductase
MEIRVRALLFAASLRKDSINARLIGVARRVLEERGVEIDEVGMNDFDCPSYDQDAEDAAPGRCASRSSTSARASRSPVYRAQVTGDG